MPATPLTDMRNLVRRDLKDEDAAAYRWTNDELDRAISRAVEQYSRVSPDPQKSTLATVASSYNIDISTLTSRVWVFSVEYPVDKHPRRFQRFSLYMDTVTLTGGDVGDGANCYVRWGKVHTLSDAPANTIPAHHDDLIALGATAYAAISWSQYASNRVNIGGDNLDRDYAIWGNNRLREFQAQLKKLKSVLRTSRMYSLEGDLSQSGDEG